MIHARWGFLLLLCGLSLLLAAARRPALPPSPAVYGLAALLAALALASSFWSFCPQCSAKRALSLIVLLVTVAALGMAAAGRERTIRRLLAGLLAGATAVAVAGVVGFAADRNSALQGAGPDAPARYKGFGVSPNTDSLLFALALPIACWLMFEARSRWGQAAALASAVLLAGSLFESGSRGATVASLAALLVLALVLGRGWRRLPLVALTLAIYAGGVQLADLRSLRAEYRASVQQGQPAIQPPVGQAPPAVRLKGNAPRRARPGGVRVAQAVHNPYGVYELGRERPGVFTPVPRGLFGGRSGRLVVWRGALDQGRKRPFLGYGFGNEDGVFVDRYYDFEGSRPENSYLGLLLQLGLVGVAVFLAIGLALLWAFARALRRAPRSWRGPAAVCAGAVLAGFVLGIFQSYAYSVGNVGTLTFWTAAFLLAASTAPTSE